MPRRSILRPELEPHQRALAAMINAALDAGQCGDGDDPRHWTKWTNRGFADKAGVSENAVANWRDPDRRMPPENIQPLLKTFYGTIERWKDDRAAMERLWRLARGYIVDDEPAGRRWTVPHAPNIQGTVKLVTLRPHAPQPGNDDTLRLALTLVITPDSNVSYRGQAITIGLADALLCLESDGWQPALRSLISERGHANFRLSAAGAWITGPADPATGMLNGEPLGEDYLAAVEPVGDGGGPIKVTVNAPRGSFRVFAGAAGGAPDQRCSTNQTAVINALLHEQFRDHDDQDMAILARGTIQPRPV